MLAVAFATLVRLAAGFASLAAGFASLAGTGALGVVELVVVALLRKRVHGSLEAGDDHILRVPLGVQECLGLLRRAQNHIVGHICRTRGVAKAATAAGPTTA